MTALSINPPYPIFTDVDGNPLNDGYVYLGVTNQNPEVVPIAAYWDTALTIPAVQPVRTSGGYPVRNGTPSRLYVNGNYSITVRNKNGSFIYSSPSVTERYSDVVVSGANANEVIYDPAGTGAVATDVQAKLRESVSVKDFGAVGDGVTDDTEAIQAAITYIASITPWPISVSRGTNRPQLYFPAGVYNVSSTFNILFSKFKVIGDGRENSVIAWTSAADTPVFDIGTFSATPADIFSGFDSTEFSKIRIMHANWGVMGSRLGQGIRCNGGGGLVLRDFAVLGFKYGVNCPYGGDFNLYSHSQFESCDVGFYQGPGGQQFYTDNIIVANCVDGVVLDRVGHSYFLLPHIGNCRDSLVKIEAVTDTSTRFCSLIPTGGTSYTSQIVFECGYFESNAGGGTNDNAVPTNLFVCNANGSDAYTNISIINPYLVLGNTGTKTVTAYFANTGAYAAQFTKHKNIVLTGALTRFLTSPSGDIIDGYKVGNGYSTPAINSGGTCKVLTQRYNSNVAASSLFPVTEAHETTDGLGGIKQEFSTSGIYRMAFNNSGSYLYRFGVDIQNRRLFLGDPSANEFSVSRSAAVPTSGTYAIGSFVYNIAPVVAAGKTLLGWQRLTTGSAHVLNTDWSPCYVTNT